MTDIVKLMKMATSNNVESKSPLTSSATYIKRLEQRNVWFLIYGFSFHYF